MDAAATLPCPNGHPANPAIPQSRNPAGFITLKAPLTKRSWKIRVRIERYSSIRKKVSTIMTAYRGEE
jgi:hypothetical protein